MPITTMIASQRIDVINSGTSATTTARHERKVTKHSSVTAM